MATSNSLCYKGVLRVGAVKLTMSHGVTSLFVTPPQRPATAGRVPPGTAGCDDLRRISRISVGSLESLSVLS
eukprot:1388131-Amorphochlora_amoeboformis.AAC.1